MKSFVGYYKVRFTAKNKFSATKKAYKQLDRLENHSQVCEARLTALDEFFIRKESF